MGQQESYEYNESPDLEVDKWEEILRYDEYMKIKDIYMNKSEYPNAVLNKYIIKLNDNVPYNCKMHCFFPKNEDPSKRKLSCVGYYGNLSFLSQTINQWRDPNVVVTCKDYFYRFHGIEGNVYLFWAKELQEQQHENLVGEIKTMVPILVETNMQMSIRNVYVFGNEYPLTPKNVMLMFNPSIEYFCCEERPSEQKKQVPKAKLIKKIFDKEKFKLKDEDAPFYEKMELELPTDRYMENLN